MGLKFHNPGSTGIETMNLLSPMKLNTGLILKTNNLEVSAFNSSLVVLSSSSQSEYKLVWHTNEQKAAAARAPKVFGKFYTFILIWLSVRLTLDAFTLSNEQFLIIFET